MLTGELASSSRFRYGPSVTRPAICQQKTKSHAENHTEDFPQPGKVPVGTVIF
jgi:hypothetical protein